VFAAAAERVTFDGQDHVARYDSSEWAARGFCRICGSHLFYHLKPADLYMLSVGAFNDATGFHLAREIFIDHKPPGYALAGNHSRLTEKETLASFGFPEDGTS